MASQFHPSFHFQTSRRLTIYNILYHTMVLARIERKESFGAGKWKSEEVFGTRWECHLTPGTGEYKSHLLDQNERKTRRREQQSRDPFTPFPILIHRDPIPFFHEIIIFPSGDGYFFGVLIKIKSAGSEFTVV